MEERAVELLCCIISKDFLSALLYANLDLWAHEHELACSKPSRALIIKLTPRFRFFLHKYQPPETESTESLQKLKQLFNFMRLNTNRA